MRDSLKAAFFALLSSLAFTVCMTLSKFLSCHINTVLMVFIRTVFSVLFFIPFLIKDGKKHFQTGFPLMHLLRVAGIFTALLLTYFTYRTLPLAFASVLGMTGALFTTLGAVFILKDKMTPLRWGLLALGYGGVLLVVQPSHFTANIGILTAFLANICAAGVSVANRYLMQRGEKSTTLMVYSILGTFTLTGVFLPFVWSTPTPQDILVLAGIGAGALVMQFGNVNAVKYASPAYVAPFEYTRIAFALPLGYFLFQETPHFLTFLGALVIVLATGLLTRLEKN